MNYLLFRHFVCAVLPEGYPCFEKGYLRNNLYLWHSCIENVKGAHLEQVGNDDVLPLCPMENVVIEDGLVNVAVRVQRVRV